MYQFGGNNSNQVANNNISNNFENNENTPSNTGTNQQIIHHSSYNPTYSNSKNNSNHHENHHHHSTTCLTESSPKDNTLLPQHPHSSYIDATAHQNHNRIQQQPNNSSTAALRQWRRRNTNTTSQMKQHETIPTSSSPSSTTSLNCGTPSSVTSNRTSSPPQPITKSQQHSTTASEENCYNPPVPLNESMPLNSIQVRTPMSDQIKPYGSQASFAHHASQSILKPQQASESASSCMNNLHNTIEHNRYQYYGPNHSIDDTPLRNKYSANINSYNNVTPSYSNMNCNKPSVTTPAYPFVNNSKTSTPPYPHVNYNNTPTSPSSVNQQQYYTKTNSLYPDCEQNDYRKRLYNRNIPENTHHSNHSGLFTPVVGPICGGDPYSTNYTQQKIEKPSEFYHYSSPTQINYNYSPGNPWYYHQKKSLPYHPSYYPNDDCARSSITENKEPMQNFHFQQSSSCYDPPANWMQCCNNNNNDASSTYYAKQTPQMPSPRMPSSSYHHPPYQPVGPPYSPETIIPKPIMPRAHHVQQPPNPGIISNGNVMNNPYLERKRYFFDEYSNRNDVYNNSVTPIKPRPLTPNKFTWTNNTDLQQPNHIQRNYSCSINNASMTDKYPFHGYSSPGGPLQNTNQSYSHLYPPSATVAPATNEWRSQRHPQIIDVQQPHPSRMVFNIHSAPTSELPPRRIPQIISNELYNPNNANGAINLRYNDYSNCQYINNQPLPPLSISSTEIDFENHIKVNELPATSSRASQKYPKLNLKEFLETWDENEEVEENTINNSSTNLPDVVLSSNKIVHCNKNLAENVKKHAEQFDSSDMMLYVLESTNVPEESVWSDYKHIQQIDKLPDNIKLVPEVIPTPAETKSSTEKTESHHIRPNNETKSSSVQHVNVNLLTNAQNSLESPDSSTSKKNNCQIRCHTVIKSPDTTVDCLTTPPNGNNDKQTPIIENDSDVVSSTCNLEVVSIEEISKKIDKKIQKITSESIHSPIVTTTSNVPAQSQKIIDFETKDITETHDSDFESSNNDEVHQNANKMIRKNYCTGECNIKSKDKCEQCEKTDELLKDLISSNNKTATDDIVLDLSGEEKRFLNYYDPSNLDNIMEKLSTNIDSIKSNQKSIDFSKEDELTSDLEAVPLDLTGDRPEKSNNFNVVEYQSVIQSTNKVIMEQYKNSLNTRNVNNIDQSKINDKSNFLNFDSKAKNFAAVKISVHLSETVNESMTENLNETMLNKGENENTKTNTKLVVTVRKQHNQIKSKNFNIKFKKHKNKKKKKKKLKKAMSLDKNYKYREKTENLNEKNDFEKFEGKQVIEEVINTNIKPNKNDVIDDEILQLVAEQSINIDLNDTKETYSNHTKMPIVEKSKFLDASNNENIPYTFKGKNTSEFEIQRKKITDCIEETDKDIQEVHITIDKDPKESIKLHSNPITINVQTLSENGANLDMGQNDNNESDHHLRTDLFFQDETSKKLDKSETLNEKQVESQICKDDVSEHTMENHANNVDNGKITEKPFTMITEIKTSLDENLMDLDKIKITNFQENQILNSLDEVNANFSKDNIVKSSNLHEMYSEESDIVLKEYGLKFATKEFIPNASEKDKNNYKNLNECINENHNINVKFSVNEDVDINSLKHLEQEPAVVLIENEKNKTNFVENIIQLENRTTQEEMSLEVDKIHKSENTECFETRNSTISININYNMDRKSTENMKLFSVERSIFSPVIQKNVSNTELSDNIDKANYETNESYDDENVLNTSGTCENKNLDIPHPSTVEKSMFTPFIENNKNNTENNISIGKPSIEENTNNTTAIHEYNNDINLTGICKQTTTDVTYQNEFTQEKTMDLNCNSEIFENKKLIHLHTKIIENEIPKILFINSCIDNTIRIINEIQDTEQNKMTVEESLIFNSSLNKNKMKSSDLFEKENQLNNFTSEDHIVNKEINEIGESLENLLEENSLGTIKTFESSSIVEETEKLNDSLGEKEFVNVNQNQNDLQFESETFSKAQVLDFEAIRLKTKSKDREKVNPVNRATKNWEISLKKRLSDTVFEKVDAEKEEKENTVENSNVKEIQGNKKGLVQRDCYTNQIVKNTQYNNEESKHTIIIENNINNSQVGHTTNMQTEQTVQCSSTKNLNYLLGKEDEEQADDKEAVSYNNKEIEKTAEFQAISNKMNQDIQSINNSNEEHLDDENFDQAKPDARTNIEIGREVIINFKNVQPSYDSKIVSKISENSPPELSDNGTEKNCTDTNHTTFDQNLDDISKEISDEAHTGLNADDSKVSYDSKTVSKISENSPPELSGNETENNCTDTNHTTFGQNLDDVSKEISDEDHTSFNADDSQVSYDSKTVSKISENSPPELNDYETEKICSDTHHTTFDQNLDNVSKEFSDEDHTSLNVDDSKLSYNATTISKTISKISENSPPELNDKETESNGTDTNHTTFDQNLDDVSKEISDEDHPGLNADNSKVSYDSKTVAKISENSPPELSDNETENNCTDTNHTNFDQNLDDVSKEISDEDHTGLNADNSKVSFDSKTVSKISENNPPELNDNETEKNCSDINHTTFDQNLDDVSKEISDDDHECLNADSSKVSEIENIFINTNYTTSDKISDDVSKTINNEYQTCLNTDDSKLSYDAKTISNISENSTLELNDKEVENNFIDRNHTISDLILDNISKEISDNDETCLNDDDSKPLYDSKIVSKISENSPPELNDKEIKNNFISINHTTSGHRCLNDNEIFAEIREQELETTTFLENSTSDINKGVVKNKKIEDNEIEDSLSPPINIKIKLSLDNLQNSESMSEISKNQKTVEETTENLENDQSTVLDVSTKLNKDELEISRTNVPGNQSFSNHLENEQTVFEMPENESETIIILEDCASTTIVSEDVAGYTKAKDNQETEENLTLQVDSNDTLFLESEDANLIFDNVILIESDFEMGENLNIDANLSENNQKERISKTEEEKPLNVMNDETDNSNDVTVFDILPNIYEEISHEEVIDEEILEIEKEIYNFTENEITNNLTEENTKKVEIADDFSNIENCEEIVCDTGNSIKTPPASYNEVETSSENVILIVKSPLNKEIDKTDSENIESAFVFDENDGLPDVILDEGDSSVIVTYSDEDGQFEHIFLSNDSQALDCFEVIDPSETIDQNTESKSDNLDKSSIQDENSNGIENEDDLWLCTEEEVISSSNSNEKYKEIDENMSSVNTDAENCERPTSSSLKLNRKESYPIIKISQNYEEKKVKITTKNIKFEGDSIKKSDFETDLSSAVTISNNNVENEEHNKSDIETARDGYKIKPEVPLKELVVSCVKIDVDILKTNKKYFTHHDSEKTRQKKRLSESEYSDTDVSQPKKICLTGNCEPASDDVKNIQNKFESNNNQTVDCSNTKMEWKKYSNSSTNDSSYENLDHETKITKSTEKKRKKFHPYIKQEVNKQNLMDELNLTDPLIVIKPLKLDHVEKNNNSLIYNNNNNSTIKSKIPPIKVKNHPSFSEILSNIDKYVYQQKKLSTFKIPKLKKNETKDDQNTLNTSIESSTDSQSPKSNGSSDSQNTNPRIKIKLKNISKYNDYQDGTTSDGKIKKDKELNTSKQYEIINNSTTQKNYKQNHKSQLVSVGDKTSGKFILKNKQFPKMIIKRTKSIENKIKNDNSVLLNNALKWQPFVKLEKNTKLDKMALKLQKQQRIVLKINRIHNNEHNNHNISSSPSLKCKIRLDKYILPSIVPNYRYN